MEFCHAWLLSNGTLGFQELHFADNLSFVPSTPQDLFCDIAISILSEVLEAIGFNTFSLSTTIVFLTIVAISIVSFFPGPVNRLKIFSSQLKLFNPLKELVR